MAQDKNKNQSTKKIISLENGELVFETGKLAKLANGSVTVQLGETVVFASACANDEASADIDFFPLRVDYQEKFSSAGKTLGGFMKREGRPSEKEILTCRLIDRPIRPMFPEGYYNEVQLISYVYSYDGINPTEPLAICAASAALCMSDIPLLKPIGAVRVGRIDGKFIINPTLAQMALSDLDLILAGTDEAILMIEGNCDFLKEDTLIEAVEYGHKAINTICTALGAWAKECGKKKHLGTLRPANLILEEKIKTKFGKDLATALQIASKTERKEALNVIESDLFDLLETEKEAGGAEYKKLEVGAAFKAVKTYVMRQMILDRGIRCDGRNLTQIRPIDIELALLPRTHGSALFTRGETQALAVCTLGGESTGQRFEDLNADQVRRFYLQYSFPPFSVGEVGRMSGASRREIGHGKLAENSLAKIIPPAGSDFAYAIRLESNTLESNGSSSMAAVCGGCLAMMDAGVPIKTPISGIAMGLILEKSPNGKERVAILSDILGDEDALGDMDFKVTGNADGVTAFQLDIKVEGITSEIMRKALNQARDGRIHILNEMNSVIKAPRNDLSPHAPRMISFEIPKEKIGAVIGTGGSVIKQIQVDYSCVVEIKEGDHTGTVTILTNDGESMKKAKAFIEGLVKVPKVGEIYEGKVVKLTAFGAFVEILPGQEGLLHVSEIAHERINDPADVLKRDEIVRVKLLEKDEKGKLRLSRKALINKDEAK